jgi:hypothetical protein
MERVCDLFNAAQSLVRSRSCWTRLVIHRLRLLLSVGAMSACQQLMRAAKPGAAASRPSPVLQVSNAVHTVAIHLWTSPLASWWQEE